MKRTLAAALAAILLLCGCGGSASQVSQVSEISKDSALSVVPEISTVSEVSVTSEISTVSEASDISEVSVVSEVSTVPEVSEASQASQASQPPAASSGAAVKITLTVGGKAFAVELDGSDTAAAFAKLLPIAFSMKELNGNEKYVYLDSPLPAAAQAVGEITAGDLMLYGDNCVVLFYESFSSPYSYTRIGRVADAAGLAAAVGDGNISAEFSLK